MCVSLINDTTHKTLAINSKAIASPDLFLKNVAVGAKHNDASAIFSRHELTSRSAIMCGSLHRSLYDKPASALWLDICGNRPGLISVRRSRRACLMHVVFLDLAGSPSKGRLAMIPPLGSV
jgi:hypothetical protein